MNLDRANEKIMNQLKKSLEHTKNVLDESQLDSFYSFNCFPLDFALEKVVEENKFSSNEFCDVPLSKDVLLSFGQNESQFTDENQNILLNQSFLFADNPCNLQDNDVALKEKEFLLKPSKFCEKKHNCSQCEKSFKKKYHLEKHQLTHSGIIKSFKCNQCEKSYTSKQNLEQHCKLTHTEKKPLYKCDLCEKRFEMFHVIINFEF